MFNSAQSDHKEYNRFSSDNLETSVNKELIKIIRTKSTELVQECHGLIQAYQNETGQALSAFNEFLKKRSASMEKILIQWEQHEESAQEIQQKWIQEENERLAIIKQFLPTENHKSKVTQKKIQYYEMLTEGDIANSAIKVLILEMRALKEQKVNVCKQCILEFSQQPNTELVALFLDFLQSNYSEKDFIEFLKTKVTVERNERDFRCTLRQFTHAKMLQEVDLQKEAGKLGHYVNNTERAMDKIETVAGTDSINALRQENETLKFQLMNLIQQCDELRKVEYLIENNSSNVMQEENENLKLQLDDLIQKYEELCHLLDSEKKANSQEKQLDQKNIKESPHFFKPKEAKTVTPPCVLTPPTSPADKNNKQSRLPARRLPVLQRKVG